MTEEIDIIVSWHEPTKSWVAATVSPPTRAKASSPKIAVNRVYRALETIVGRRGSLRAIPKVVVPHDLHAAWKRYRDTSMEAAEKRETMRRSQLELGRLLMEKYGLNRSHAAAIIGLAKSHFGRLLAGKFVRDSEIVELSDPAEALSNHVAKSKQQ